MISHPPNSSDDPLGRTGPYERINSLCESFSQEWNPKGRPSLDDYLDQVGDEAQSTLMRNLLHIEIDRRRTAGEQPSAEEYLQKYPKLAAMIRQVFFEASSALTGRRHETPDSVPAAVKVPAANRLGDYQLLRELGRGGMGTVYEVVHTKRGNHAALKTLPEVDGARLYLFKREFRALADVNHPNLIGLHTLESDGCHWFFTMDLIDGVDFLSHVRPGGALDLSRLRPALAQLVTGVLALHGKHIIHRDLKPSNVMVTRDGQVRILDFGLVLEADQSWSADKIAGTPKYMAPEQAAGATLTAACDWYAVGVMLYEALVGRSPFVGGAFQVIQAKQMSDPLALTVGPLIPEDLAALAMRLLSRDPGQRPDARSIVKVIAAQAEMPVATRPVSGSGLVGRDQQLAALNDAYRWLRKHNQPLTVFIRGRSGEGKTSLAEHFVEPLRKKRAEIAVMSGRCYDRESVPFKALDSLKARLSEAIKAFEESGDLYELHLAHFHQGCCQFGLGNLAEAVNEACWTFASSARIGDSRTLCSSYLWARATRGNIPFEELKSCYPCRPDDVMSTVHGVMAEGHWHTFHGRTAEALDAFERAGAMVRESLCVNSHKILTLPELAGALRRHADAVESKDAKQCAQLRKRAYRLAKWATRITLLFPAARPLALRERALILAAYGKTKKALKYADKSCAVAEKQKAMYEHAQSLLVRGRLAKELGLAEADGQIRQAEAALDEIERQIRGATHGRQHEESDRKSAQGTR